MGEGTLVAGVAWAAAALFGLSVHHKVRVLLAGRPASEPVLAAAPWLQARPRAALSVSAALEIVLCVGLVLLAPWALVGATVVVAAYAGLLHRLPADAPCHCFGASSAARAGSALLRNAVLAVALGAGSVAAVVADAPTEPLSAIGASAVVLAIVGAFEALERSPGATWRRSA